MNLRTRFEWGGLCVAVSVSLLGCLAGCAAVAASRPERYGRAVEAAVVVHDGTGQLLIAGKGVTMWEGRTIQSKAVGNLKVGQRVRAGFLQSGWYAVFDPHETDLREDRALGYVQARLLLPAAEEVWGQIKYLHAETNIRAGRGGDTRVVGRLAAGQPVKADFLEKNWYAVFDVQETVRNEDHALGYVSAPLLKDEPLPR